MIIASRESVVVRLVAARAVLAVAMVLLVVAGCAPGTDGGDAAYSFVSPGGQTRIFYSEAERRPIAEISGESLLEEGRQIRLSDFAGQVVVLNIWGSWCVPCRAEMPELQRVYEQTRGSGVRFLGIDIRDGVRSAPQDFVRNLGITYPSIYDPPGRSLLALQGYPRSVVPSTLVLDRQHRVAAVFLEQLTESDLLPVVRGIAEDSPRASGSVR